MGGNKGSPGAASKDSEEVPGEIEEGVVEVSVLAIPFKPTVVSSLEFVGGVEGEMDLGLRESGFGGEN
jgi:hypothetical protein